MFPIKDDLKKPEQLFWFLFLAGTYALIAFVFFVEYQSFWPRVKGNDFSDYVLGWVFFVPLGFLAALLSRKLNQAILNDRAFGPIAAISNFLYFLCLLYPAFWLTGLDPLNACLKGGFSFLGVQLFAFLIVKITQKANSKILRFFEENAFIFTGLIFAVWVLNLTFTHYRFISNFSFYNFLIWGFVVFSVSLALFLETGKNKSRVVVRPLSLFSKTAFLSYAFILLFIALMVIDPNFDFNYEHYNFFLGPLADLRGGKAFLVNINSYYGILIFYFLSFFFKILPLGFKSLSLVLTFLYIVQYFLFYFIVRRLFGSGLYSFLCLVILLLVNYFQPRGSVIFFPSVGPLRFGFVYTLLILVILRNQYPSYRKYFFIAESLVVALAFSWSLDVCAYTLPAYLGLVFYEFVRSGDISKAGWALPAKRISLLAGFCAIFMAFIYGDIYRRTHQFPHWSYYFDCIELSKKGYYMILMPPLDAWWLLLGILYLSFFIILGSLVRTGKENLPPHFNAMALLTFYGIMQFSYYAGRANFNNLYHISMPGILLSAYWLYWLWSEKSPLIPAAVKKTVIVLSITALGLYLQSFIPLTVLKLNYTLKLMRFLPQTAWAAANDLPRDDDFAKTADALMNQYSGSQKKLVYFFGYRGLEVSMYTGRVNAYPYSDIGQASVCPSTMNRIISTPPPVSVGDCVYLSKDMETAAYNVSDSQQALSPMEGELLSRIKQKYILTLMETRNGISVYRVTRLKTII